MSMFRRESSCATRAERRLGRLLSAESSMVLMFEHARLSLVTPLGADVEPLLFAVVLPLGEMHVDRG